MNSTDIDLLEYRSHFKKVAFVGHFSSSESRVDLGVSPAGDQVQSEIFKSIIAVMPYAEVIAISMQPVASWPRGKLFKNSLTTFNVKFLGFFNIPIFKHLIFSIGLLYQLIKLSPDLCIQYNSYFFENICLRLYRLLKPSVKISIIIQDVHVDKDFGIGKFVKEGAKSALEFFSMRSAKKADCVVAISDAIVEDFCFNKRTSFIFPGGVTSFAHPLLLSQLISNEVDKYAVFAGALEPHNGINKIIDGWLSQSIPYVLHIFGRGSLSAYVKAASERSDYIVYHGFVSDTIVRDFQESAHWNICLRYSIGLDERYFFPSKFFNSACAPGHLIVNRFYGLPNILLDHLLIVNSDFSNLSDLIECSSNDVSSADVILRRDVVKRNFSWNVCVSEILNRCVGDRDA